jgi:hypothetical protein
MGFLSRKPMIVDLDLLRFDLFSILPTAVSG